MPQSAQSGNKIKNRRRKASVDSKTFRPGLEDEEKIRRHRKAQSRYYASNPNVQVRRREQAAERLAAAKLLKRRWDPPKQARKPARQLHCPVSSHASGEILDDGFSFKDPRAQSKSGNESSKFDHDGASDLNAAVGTAASPTSEEFLAIHALTQLAEGITSHVLKDTHFEDTIRDDASAHKANAGLVQEGSPADFKVNENPIDDWRAESSGDTSILEKANQLSALSEGYPYLAACNSNIPLAVRRGELPPGVTPLNPLQELTLRITGDVGPMTVVQAAQIEVAELNSGDLSANAPTPEDAASWQVPGRLVTHLWSHQDLTKKEIATGRWRVDVCKALRRARLAGETIEN